ncbi:MAG: stage III sporulation protein AD [Clostridia bacterium]|jgi:stage III sporulation protein AD|nr:stage III sporulation protein AD [Clostridiaceae bacterium]
MNIFQIVVIGIVGVLLVLTVKEKNPEFALGTSLITGAVILVAVITRFDGIFDFLNRYMTVDGFNSDYIKILMKILGIAYVTQFGAEICKDAGAASVASKIELAGKVIILSYGIPIILSLLDTVRGILG